MRDSYRGFIIEYESTDSLSGYTWLVVDIDANVYQCSGREYECSGDAESAAEQWIDYFIKSLPDTDAVKTTLKNQERLKAIEEELQKLTDSPYAEEVNKYLYDALENVTEALKVNYRYIRSASKNQL